MGPITVLHSIRRWLSKTETWLYNQVCYLPAKVESHVVCEKTDNLDQFAIPNLHSMKPRHQWQFVQIRTIRKMGLRPRNSFLLKRAKSIKPDLIHSHFGPVAWENLTIAKELGVPHVATFYGVDVTYYPKNYRRWYARYEQLFQDIDLVLCEGSFMGQSLAALGCPEDKIRLHHLGVPVQEIKFAPRKWRPGETMKVLIAASFREKKGIPYALDALGRTQNDVDLQITIIGDADKKARCQREKESILAKISEHNLAGKTRLLGYQPYETLLEEAASHHIFLSPSVTASDGDSEGGAPVTLIEMAAAGMPIISTTHCDIPEVIIHRKTGLLAAERNVEELVDHIRWLIGHPDQWLAMLNSGRAHIEQNYAATGQGSRLGDIYRNLNEGVLERA